MRHALNLRSPAINSYWFAPIRRTVSGCNNPLSLMLFPKGCPIQSVQKFFLVEMDSVQSSLSEFQLLFSFLVIKSTKRTTSNVNTKLISKLLQLMCVFRLSRK